MATHPHRARRSIGVTGQFATVDEALFAGRSRYSSRLLGARIRAAKARADELIPLFDLVEAADRPARTYSGGMRRRLDLAADPRLTFDLPQH